MDSVRARVGATLIAGAFLVAGAAPALAGPPPTGGTSPVGATPTPPTAAANAATSALQRKLQTDLVRAGGTGSALVVDLTSGATLYTDAADAPRLPASVEKLYTTSTALLTFGATASLQTSVLGVGGLSGGTWHGALFLRGGGDPTFGNASFDHAAYGTGATVQQLAHALEAAGIHRVDGPIIGDETAFDPLRGTPATGFAPDLELEGELSGLSYDAGFTSPAEIALQSRPALFATQAFVAALNAAGVAVPRGTLVFTGVTPPGARLLASVASPPIATLIQLTNTPSDNFFAETLLKDIGARYGAGGTTAAGVGVVESTMQHDFDIDPRLNDGSGLSRFDRTTAAQVVSLLERQVDDQPFVDSLAVAGVSGTLQHEMRGTPAANNCRGKTGTLSDVANLVGYCTAHNGDRLVFAFFLNGVANPDSAHDSEDQMAAALASYDPPTAG